MFPSIAWAVARLVSSLLYYGTLTLNLTAFENQKYAAYNFFYGNSPDGKIPTKKRTNQNAWIYLAI